MKMKLSETTKPENNITNTTLARLLAGAPWWWCETVSSSTSWSESRDSDFTEEAKNCSSVCRTSSEKWTK